MEPTRFEVGDISPRITWRKVVEIWKKAVPGTDDEKEAAVAELARVWKLRTGKILPTFLDA